MRPEFARLVCREQNLARSPAAIDSRRTNLVSTDAKPLLFFFWSEQSGPARRMESLLAQLARKERMRLRVMRIDVDTQPDLVERLGVSEVPTLVLVKGKRVVDRLEGRTSAPKIELMLERHLAAAAA